ncbi:MAG: 50S ribosomal protein L11 methyltransferase [Desulfobacteraceae bacterium]|nr:50S ribosomal protein L11 methyltransferase [Pseudomonadota bacterium]MBU4463744.1 50S ribosomal protein L11 methyltransferase [Pseudomonadota bacterium]MCG2754659.1 50S ribosomal protein L11 methyltransferase [Desulfobacteraceae bacterium]
MNEQYDLNSIKHKVAETVFESDKHLTQLDIEKELANRYFYPKKQIKQAIKVLVAEQTLAYTYKYGHSFLEKSFNKPVRISKRIVIKPPGIAYRREPGDLVIELLRGVSFGNGEHPTTRLAIRGVEHALSSDKFLRDEQNTFALDIGTGSGVLVIAAVLLGINRAIGIDIDSVARSEAKKNISLNNLSNRISIHNRSLDDINQQFSLIIANLRYPTLKKLYSLLDLITEQQAAVVLSGLKTSEMPDVQKLYTQKFFKLESSEVEKGWGAMVFEKRDL